LGMPRRRQGRARIGSVLRHPEIHIIRKDAWMKNWQAGPWYQSWCCGLDRNAFKERGTGRENDPARESPAR
jgi:hypothetical protein